MQKKNKKQLNYYFCFRQTSPNDIFLIVSNRCRHCYMLQLQNKIQTLLNKKVRKYKHHNKKKRNSIKHHKILNIEDIVSTNLEDCSGTTRVHNLFDKSVVPDVGSNGRQEAMVGRTCNTQNTPREIPNPVSLTRNPSS